VIGSVISANIAGSALAVNFATAAAAQMPDGFGEGHATCAAQPIDRVAMRAAAVAVEMVSIHVQRRRAFTVQRTACLKAAAFAYERDRLRDERWEIGSCFQRS
jgi:hypothetical protein